MAVFKRAVLKAKSMMRRSPPISRVEGNDYNDAPDFARAVFIGGLHRSGTTLLERMLAARYDVSVLRANVPESEGQHMQSVYAPGAAYGGPGRFALSEKAQEDLRALPGAEACRAKMLADWKRFWVGTSPILLEKSPPNLTKIWWLRQVFPGARFVIMSRDPRAVAGATHKWTHSTLAEMMAHWDAAYTRALADFRDEDCILVRYEDLVEDPEGEIARLGAFIGAPERPAEAEVEDRHSELRNSNAKYFEMHEGARYGAGAWDKLGYEV
ncbi:sulfotransferase family protein [Rhodovulum sp. DZ06]|uniref:sulfotransferase family protein n=1 Tax=Rhodovulum sp. DZ06 TaxID=3425126 RepID=UPI003D343BAD